MVTPADREAIRARAREAFARAGILLAAPRPDRAAVDAAERADAEAREARAEAAAWAAKLDGARPVAGEVRKVKAAAPARPAADGARPAVGLVRKTNADARVERPPSATFLRIRAAEEAVFARNPHQEDPNWSPTMRIIDATGHVIAVLRAGIAAVMQADAEANDQRIAALEERIAKIEAGDGR